MIKLHILKKNPFNAKVVKVIGNDSQFSFPCYAADYDINQSYSTSLYCSRRNLLFA